MVNVYLGPKRKKHHLHKDLLCDRSAFFRSALSGGFREQEECAVYLPDDNVEAFVLFVQWIYGARLKRAATTAPVKTLLALYVMAEKFCMETLKNLAMDLIRAFYSTADLESLTEHIEYVYSSTPTSSPIRRFVSNFATYNILEQRTTMSLEFLDLMKKGGDFAADFASATWKYITTDPSMGRKCVYHEHNFTKPCPV